MVAYDRETVRDERRPMNERDVLTLQDMATRNVEVERLLLRHQDFEERIASLGRHKWLSADEQREVKRLKQLKLAGRDRMQKILSTAALSA